MTCGLARRTVAVFRFTGTGPARVPRAHNVGERDLLAVSFPDCPLVEAGEDSDHLVTRHAVPAGAPAGPGEPVLGESAQDRTQALPIAVRAHAVRGDGRPWAGIVLEPQVVVDEEGHSLVDKRFVRQASGLPSVAGEQHQLHPRKLLPRHDLRQGVGGQTVVDAQSDTAEMHEYRASCGCCAYLQVGSQPRRWATTGNRRAWSSEAVREAQDHDQGMIHRIQGGGAGRPGAAVAPGS